MTVSDNARNHWFIYPISFAILFCLTAFGPQNAKAQTAIYDGGICKLANRSPEPVRSYRIIPKTNPPSGQMKPGDKYQIAYEIYTSCAIRCADVAELDLLVIAKLGKNKYFDYAGRTGTGGPVSGKIIKKAKMYRHSCGETKTRVVKYTVPYPGEVQQNFDRENTWMTIGLCPPTPPNKCAKHSIFVENADKSGWRVRMQDLLTTGGSGPNQVSVLANIKVTNQTGSGLWPDHQKRVEFWRVARRGESSNLKIDDKPLPSISAGNNARIEFRDTVTGDGVRWYYACMTGPDKNGWPTPKICSPAKVIDVSLSDGQRFEVGPVGANPGGQIRTTAPAGVSFRASFSVRNKTTVNAAAGNKFYSVWQRQTRISQPGKRIVIGSLGVVGGSRTIVKAFRIAALPAGLYDFRACVASRREEQPARAVCGPWSPITIGTGKVRPTPQPIAPVANSCTGGRVFDRSQGRCVCEGDLFWNPGLKRCYQCTRGRNWNASQNRCICPSGTAWNQRANRCAPPTATRCTGGRTKNAQGRCACPTGSFWNPNPGFKRCYTCTAGRIWNGNQRRCVCPPGVKWNQRANRCGAAFQAVPTPQVRLPGLGTPAKITCTGGRVSNRACLCPRGFTRKTIRANVYLCKPPLRRPVPNAMGNRLKTPKTNKMRCIGGQVKGPLCWCGIGRFPKKIGSNAYRCQ